EDATSGVAGRVGNTIGEAIALQIGEHGGINASGLDLLVGRHVGIATCRFIGRHEGRRPRQTGEGNILTTSALEVITDVAVPVDKAANVSRILALHHCTASHGLACCGCSSENCSVAEPSGLMVAPQIATPALLACRMARSSVTLRFLVL